VQAATRVNAEHASHDAVQVKGPHQGSIEKPPVARYPRSEPDLNDAARFRARSTSHTVAAHDGCTKIPLAAHRAQEDENHSRKRRLRPWLASVRLPGSARTDQVQEDDGVRLVCRQAAVIAAPSMTTPALTYFQSATSSFRASATIVVFRRRPPLRLTRSWNQRVSAECG
jgi:hypothetical protein